MFEVAINQTRIGESDVTCEVPSHLAYTNKLQKTIFSFQEMFIHTFTPNIIVANLYFMQPLY